MSATSEATFLKAFPKAWGRPASVGMPTSRLKAAMFATPARNFWISTASLMSSTAASKTEPSWKTCWTSMPYSNGLMPSFASRIAELGLTFSPITRILKSETSSIWPFTIFVPMFRAWKKEVCEGSMPVGPAGMAQSTMDTWPVLAADGRRNFWRVALMSSSVQFVAKMKPRLPRISERSLSRPASGYCSWPSCRPFRIIVFLPISTTALPRRSMRMSCICFEATWSTQTMSALGWFTQRSVSLSK
mmetsp:Transcript_54676/g.155585  ORF Transcript_54676/g.155585 Transcript_54676/m.155585 type:complete len:246 (-) Transcript_54676:120-857(-)